MLSDEELNGFGKADVHNIGMGKVLKMGKNMEDNEPINLLQFLKNDSNGSFCQMKTEQDIRSVEEVKCNKPRFEATRTMLPQLRVGRPPIEGRGRGQLLPRYWPKITEQELQQISEEYP